MNRSFLLAGSAAVLVSTVWLGCSSTQSEGFGDAGAGGPSLVAEGGCGITGCSDSQTSVDCVNLECQRPKCAGGTVNTTKVSGRVFDPKGDVPLYNVVVYIPNSEPKPITHGAVCETCGSVAVNPVGGAVLTNTNGEFTIENAPAGKDIPLVMQVGKWRRQLKVNVEPCTDNRFEDPQMMHLPRNQSEGDMPKMALTTGGCDPFGCLFRRLGIDESEFTNPQGKGAVHVFKGLGGGDVKGGGAPAPETALWDSVSSLQKYDIVLLSCECGENNQTKPAAAKKAMRDYMNGGGRVFATHFHYTWFKNGEPDLAGLANWDSPGGIGLAYTIDQTFPKGMAMAEWLVNVKASPQKGTISLMDTADDVGTVNAGAQRWIYESAFGAETVKYFTFNTPVGAKPDVQCGRGVMSDLHVSDNGGDDTNMPTACGTLPLTPQERALEFMFFDLSSCVQDDKIPPTPPK
ncbi:MAG: carboxypeptidase regulatory-like domain-containing protein [Polyangiaceae bacterium]